MNGPASGGTIVRLTLVRRLAAGALMTAALGLGTPVRSAVGGDFYVAPTGRDDNTGSAEHPFASLERARDAVRAAKQNAPGRGYTVLIHGGIYSLRRSVVFSGPDSGTATAPIAYLAFPGETPIFRGSQAITGWKPFRGQILSVVLPDTEDQQWSFRQLFCGGERQIRARYPNFDPREPDYGGWAFIGATVPDGAAGAVSFRGEAGVFPRHWAKPQQGEIFIIPGLAWNSQVIPIQAYEPATGLITVSRRLGLRWDNLLKGNRFYVENLLEELDQPGEWCFDRDTRTLYFWPPQGTLAGAEVTVPVTDRLIELRATDGQPVRYLRFSGLTFTQSLSVFPYFNPRQPDYVDCNRPNSAGYAFFLENTEHCTVEKCRFDQVGGDAIRLHGYSGYNRIVGNEIERVGGQGICFANLDLWPYDFPPTWRGRLAEMHTVSSRLPWAIGNVVADNHIHHCGTIDNFGAGIHLHGFNTSGNVIAHNHIHDQPHHAIYLSMGFGPNVIEYNNLHDLCRVMADAGGVYVNRWSILDDDAVLQKGLVIRYNRVSDVTGVDPQALPAANPAAASSEKRLQRPHFTWGIYFDNSPRRAEVYGNICLNNVEGGVFLGGGYSEPEDCRVENNVFVNSSAAQFDVSMGAGAHGNRFLRNVVYYTQPKAALLRAARVSHNSIGGSNAGLATCDQNVYFLVGGGPLRVSGLPAATLAEWRERGFDRQSLVADPRFVDPAAGDYRLRPDSPAWALGFKPIPLDRIASAGTPSPSAD